VAPEAARHRRAVRLGAVRLRRGALQCAGGADHRILRADLVIVDELGFAPLDRVGGNHLFRLVAAAYEARSLIITASHPFEDWDKFLPDAAVATAILDRFVHPCQALVFDGPSYRLKEARGTSTPRPRGRGGSRRH
jgi:DNA replication protein DnaC